MTSVVSLMAGIRHEVVVTIPVAVKQYSGAAQVRIGHLDEDEDLGFLLEKHHQVVVSKSFWAIADHDTTITLVQSTGDAASDLAQVLEKLDTIDDELQDAGEERDENVESRNAKLQEIKNATEELEDDLVQVIEKLNTIDDELQSAEESRDVKLQEIRDDIEGLEGVDVDLTPILEKLTALNGRMDDLEDTCGSTCCGGGSGGDNSDGQGGGPGAETGGGTQISPAVDPDAAPEGRWIVKTKSGEYYTGDADTLFTGREPAHLWSTNCTDLMLWVVAPPVIQMLEAGSSVLISVGGDSDSYTSVENSNASISTTEEGEHCMLWALAKENPFPDWVNANRDMLQFEGGIRIRIKNVDEETKVMYTMTPVWVDLKKGAVMEIFSIDPRLFKVRVDDKNKVENYWFKKPNGTLVTQDSFEQWEQVKIREIDGSSYIKAGEDMKVNIIPSNELGVEEGCN